MRRIVTNIDERTLAISFEIVEITVGDGCVELKG
jgi:hypothetical protein